MASASYGFVEGLVAVHYGLGLGEGWVPNLLSWFGCRVQIRLGLCPCAALLGEMPSTSIYIYMYM